MQKWFCLFLFLISCQQIENKNTIRITLPTEPPTLDWNKATDNVAYQILNQLMEGLAQYDSNLNPVPAVAKSWEILDEGKTYVFHLNPDYKWSDGKTVSAYDFEFSWMRLLSPQLASEYAYFLFDIKGAQDFNAGKNVKVGIDVIDELTLKITLDKAAVYFPSITTFMVTYPLRRDVVEKFGDQWTHPENMLTLGPYQLSQWWHDYRLKLTANPFYGGFPKPKIKEIKIYLVADPSTAVALFEKDEVDVVKPHPMALSYYQNSEELITLPQLRNTYVGFNIQKKPFDNVLLRKALALSLNKKEIPNLLQNSGVETNSWIPPGMFGFNSEIGFSFNPIEAQKIIENYDKQNLKIEYYFNSDATNKKIAEWLQSQWKKNLNIEVELNNQEWKTYLTQLRQNPPGLFRLGWGADYPDPDNFMNLFTSHSGNNHTQWKNQEYDSLIKKGAVESDLNKRKKIYDKAQKLLLMDEVIIIPLFVQTQNVLVKKRFHPYPITGLDFIYYKKVEIN